jgi:hypothetical protein
MKDDTNHMQAQDQDIKSALCDAANSRTHSADPKKSELARWR